MKKVITIQYTKERSVELRAKREVSFTLAEGEASIENLTFAEYLLIVDDQRIPQWVAEINRFAITPGDHPRPITVSLGRTASLCEAWLEVAKIIQGKSLTHAKVELLDVEALFNVGNLIASNAGEPFDSLTAKDAATRLAWTYGVKTSQVKISIEL